MTDFGINVDPAEVGIDAARLARIDEHFAGYVDDGRLPGYQLAISRRGRIAHLTSYGSADIEAGRAVETDTIWRIYSMTKPITSVAAMMLYEQGAFELTDPISRWLPGVRGTCGSTSAGRPPSPRPCRRPSRSGSGTCSPTPRA